jgi:hypothetical protein
MAIGDFRVVHQVALWEASLTKFTYQTTANAMFERRYCSRNRGKLQKCLVSGCLAGMTLTDYGDHE